MVNRIFAALCFPCSPTERRPDTNNIQFRHLPVTDALISSARMNPTVQMGIADSTLDNRSVEVVHVANDSARRDAPAAAVYRWNVLPEIDDMIIQRLPLETSALLNLALACKTTYGIAAHKLPASLGMRRVNKIITAVTRPTTLPASHEYIREFHAILNEIENINSLSDRALILTTLAKGLTRPLDVLTSLVAPGSVEAINNFKILAFHGLLNAADTLNESGKVALFSLLATYIGELPDPSTAFINLWKATEAVHGDGTLHIDGKAALLIALAENIPMTPALSQGLTEWSTLAAALHKNKETLHEEDKAALRRVWETNIANISELGKALNNLMAMAQTLGAHKNAVVAALMNNCLSGRFAIPSGTGW